MTWDAVAVRRWLEARIAAARNDQVAAERYGRERQDDCDKAAAEEMVCSAVNSKPATETQDVFVRQLKELQDRDQYIWRGVYDDGGFDRHVRSYLRKLMKMAKSGTGFENTRRYQQAR